MEALWVGFLAFLGSLFYNIVNVFFWVWLVLWVIEYFDLVNFIAKAVAIISGGL